MLNSKYCCFKIVTIALQNKYALTVGRTDFLLYPFTTSSLI